MLRKLVRTAKTFVPALDDAVFWTRRAALAALRLPHERDFRLLAGFRPRPGEALLDIGANRGQSVDALQLFQPQVPVVAFEPNPLMFARLQRLHGGAPGVTLRPVGLGAETAEHDLHIPLLRGYAFDGLASFDRENAAGWLAKGGVFLYDPAKLTIETRRARIERWDDQGLVAGFAKVDVQGAEEDVIAGGLESIRRDEPLLMFEQGPERKPYRSLLEIGYKPYAFDGEHLRPDTLGALNTFYITPARRSELQIKDFVGG